MTLIRKNHVLQICLWVANFEDHNVLNPNSLRLSMPKARQSVTHHVFLESRVLSIHVHDAQIEGRVYVTQPISPLIVLGRFRHIALVVLRVPAHRVERGRVFLRYTYKPY